MKVKEPKEIFYQALFGSIFITIFGIYLSIRGNKEKADFTQVTGTIDFYDINFDNLKKRDHRYIHLIEHPLIFDLFIGKETGDFSPKFEQLDKLKIGDKITIYHDNQTPFQKNRDLRLNKTVQFIDMNGQPYFIRGNKDKYGGYLLGTLGVILIFSLIALKKFEKII